MYNRNLYIVPGITIAEQSNGKFYPFSKFRRLMPANRDHFLLPLIEKYPLFAKMGTSMVYALVGTGEWPLSQFERQRSRQHVVMQAIAVYTHILHMMT